MNVIYINCAKQPFVARIMARAKLFETRNRNTLGRFIGERVLIAESGRHGRPLVRCSAVISEIISVRTPEEWNRYRPDFGIDQGSSFDWKPDTRVKWLYRLTDVRMFLPFRLPADVVRHGRTWCELKGE